LIREVPVDVIDLNPNNSRSNYDSSGIRRMALSLSTKGQLEVVKVRPHPSLRGRYQLVFGERRLLAARSLGWKAIRADIVNMNDEEMLEQSLIENLERESISDYDKALVFRKFNKSFNKTYEEIARLVGTSRQNISNHVGMLDLFTSEEISKDPELAKALHGLTEHHARLLAGLQDRPSRITLAKMVVKDETSVRELEHIIDRMKGWLPADVIIGETQTSGTTRRKEAKVVEKITGIVMDYMRFAHEGRWRDFLEFHLFKGGFTMYDDLPPHHLLNIDEAYSKKKEWVKVAAPKMTANIKDLKVDVLKNVAIVTLEVSYAGKLQGVPVVSTNRGTLVFVERRKTWKIFHEHWSRMDDGKGRGSVVADLIDLAAAPSSTPKAPSSTKTRKPES
jgi:ParB/RepB/Spo0J family partition protein